MCIMSYCHSFYLRSISCCHAYSLPVHLYHLLGHHTYYSSGTAVLYMSAFASLCKSQPTIILPFVISICYQYLLLSVFVIKLFLTGLPPSVFAGCVVNAAID
jgi:hypothetical protein